MASSLAGLRRAKPYPSDTTDDQWAIIAPFVATTAEVGRGSKGGRPLDYDRREIIDAIFYENRTGCQWRYLPHDFPPHETVYRYFRTWSADGTLEAIHDALHEAVRSATPDPFDHDEDGGGQDASTRSALPTAGVIDSQSIVAAPTVGRAGDPPAASRNRPEGVADSRGYDAGKHVNGRKRHVLVDTLGLVIDVVVTAASVSDNAGGLAVLVKAVDKEAGAHLQKVWVDGGYKNAFAAGAERLGVDAEVVAKPPGQKGFHVLARRWVVERTHAWITGCRRLARDYERRHLYAEADVKIASIGIMLRRLVLQP